MRRSFSVLARCAMLSTLFCATNTFAQAVSPSIAITGFVSAPTNSCATPFAELTVNARGSANTSDNYSLFANGTQIYRWTGETMAWVRGSGDTYTVLGELTNLAPNTTITALIIAYDRANPAGPNFVAGNAVYQSQISWNCTSGQQIGAVANVDLTPRDVPTLGRAQLALLLGALFVLAMRFRKKQH